MGCLNIESMASMLSPVKTATPSISSNRRLGGESTSQVRPSTTWMTPRWSPGGLLRAVGRSRFRHSSESTWLLRSRLSSSELIALLDQTLEFGLLLSDAFRRPLFVGRAGVGGRLLDQLAEVLRYGRDAVVDLRNAQRNVRPG